MAAVLGCPSLSSAIWPVAWGGTPPSSWGSCWSPSSRRGPSVRHLDDAFTAPPSGDAGVYVWNTWVFRHELQQGRLPFYTSSILSGTPDAAPANLSLHNYTTVANVLAWPLIPLVGLVAAFNLVFLFNIALSGYAAYLLARDLTARDAESWIAGAAFALSPVLIARGVGHFSLVAAAPLPIFALLMRRLGATGQIRYAVRARRGGRVGDLFGRLLRRLLRADGRPQPAGAVHQHRARHRRARRADRRAAPGARRQRAGGRQLRRRDRPSRRRHPRGLRHPRPAPTRCTRRYCC